jgi:YD repeat-containing protein
MMRWSYIFFFLVLAQPGTTQNLEADDTLRLKAEMLKMRTNHIHMCFIYREDTVVKTKPNLNDSLITGAHRYVWIKKEYDTLGALVAEIEFNKAGVVVRHEKFEYINKYWHSAIYRKLANHTGHYTKSYSKYTYDEHGYCTRGEHLYADQTLHIDSTQYEYDANGNMIHAVRYSPKFDSEYWCEYDSQDRLIRSYSNSYEYRYTYDSLGRKTQWKITYYTGNMSDITIHTYSYKENSYSDVYTRVHGQEIYTIATHFMRGKSHSAKLRDTTIEGEWITEERAGELTQATYGYDRVEDMFDIVYHVYKTKYEYEVFK